jgi:UDP-N-acetylglucosamine:LPS N-acetylglucosamine transferase
VAPALAVAKALVARGHPPSTVHFIGSRRGLEARLVPAAGFSVTLLPGRGIVRRFTPADIRANLASVGGLLAAVVRSFALLARRRPAVVVSVGGYASVPGAVAAAALRIPLVLVGLDAVPGAALRMVARFARASAVAFPGTPLPRAVVTGNPVRPEIIAVDRSPESRAAARRSLGAPPGRLLVLAFGGSLGSRRINQAVAGLARAWAGRDDVAVRHVVGRRDWAEAGGPPVPGPAGMGPADMGPADMRPAGMGPAGQGVPAEGLVYEAVEYEDRMPLAFAAADVAVCRAGATTVAELAVVGLPAVLVPLPHAPGDHQTANARALSAAGAAVLVPDPELTAERLAAELEPLLADGGRLEAMGAAARELGRPDAASAVAELVERHAR